MTPFDELTSNQTLLMLKLMLPYTPADGQHMLGVLIRFMELQQTISYFHGFPSKLSAQTQAPPSPADLLQDLLPYLPEEEAQTLEQMSGMMQMMEMMQSMQSASSEAGNPQGSSSPMDMMMGMLSPDQQEMFQAYNSMFSDTMNQMNSQEMKGDEENERMDEPSGNEKY